MSGRIFFIGNSAEKGAGMAVISGSQVKVKRVPIYLLLYFFQVDLSRLESGHFENNFVNSYGGVLWADEASTEATYENLVFDYSFDDVDRTRPCFISFGNEHPEQQVYFVVATKVLGRTKDVVV